MKIAIVHNAIEDSDRPDEADVQVQVDAVSNALTELEHETVTVPCTLDLSRLKEILSDLKPDRVFNLVESLDGQDRLIHLVPSILDTLSLPYTGCVSTALFMTSNKLLAKSRMLACHIPTPAFVPGSALLSDENESPVPVSFSNTAWLIKSVWDHASYGIKEDVLNTASHAADLEVLLEQKHRETGKEWFAEQYIDGREFNVSILDSQQGPLILPPAEICFCDFPKNKPKIVGYKAKWETDSFEYQHTVRRFDFPFSDTPLLEKIRRITLKCRQAFHLSGYARVDFRVDPAGRPWVLEINANPCLSPDAGFAAALTRAGISYTKGIHRIVESASRIYPQHRPLPSHGNALKEEENAPRGIRRNIVFRHEVTPDDVPVIEEMTRKTGFFREDEIQIAVELARERLAKGLESGYHFVFAVCSGKIAGYACYGPIPCTLTSFDLYWIAVYPDFQNQGIGQQLLAETEKQVRQQGGETLYIETSHKDQYAPTRSFYTRCGYTLVSLLENFYAPGDSKATYCKTLF